MTMASLPCYKKTMENEYPLLRDILLEVTIPEVYKTVIADKDKCIGMRHALAILGMLNRSLQITVMQKMGRKSADRRWKMQGTIQHNLISDTCSDKERLVSFDESDWHRRKWDSGTLLALCHIPIRRLVADATRSKSLNLQDLFKLMRVTTFDNVHNVDIIRVLLATISVPLLCSELCSLHDKLENPSFLDSASSVGMLHYLAAMIASRHVFFTGGMPEVRPQSTHTYDNDSDVCDSCLEAIISRVQERQLIHPGLSQAMRKHKYFTVARGGWSRYKLIDAYASKNTTVLFVLNDELARCENGPSSLCMKLLNTRNCAHGFHHLLMSNPRVSLIGKMRDLIDAHAFDIRRLACAHREVSDRYVPADIICLLEHLEKEGKLLDFVQNIYQLDEDFGITMALLY